MKTLTEFDGFALKNALAKKKELTDAGKTAEELPAALGEALKLEGDRLTFMMAAMEVAESRLDGLKRVVVYTVDEGKTAPKGAVQKGEKHYLAEYFFTAQPKRAGGRDGDRPGRGGKRGGKGDKRGGKRGERGGGGGRGRGPRPEGAPAEGGAEARAPREARGPRENRGPRPQGAGGKPNVLPNVKPNAASQTASDAPPKPAGDETPST